MKKIQLLLSIVLLCPMAFLAQSKNTEAMPGKISQVNVLDNGDFSKGNSGFYSSYIFASKNTTEGEFFIGKDPSNWYPDHYACDDHTNGKGKMLLVNGSPEANRIIWKTIAKINPGRKYQFTFWITSISVPNPAVLALVINGKEVSVFRAKGKPCVWESNSVSWIPDGSGSASISLINKNTIRYGNDFALDDISFIESSESYSKPVCEEKVPAAFNFTIYACNQVKFNLIHNTDKGLSGVQWYFGDGQRATEQSPTHIYQENKTYTAKAIVTSKNGCKDSFSGNVPIVPFKIAPFKSDETEPGLIRFSTSIENVKYVWDFGDNNTELNKQVTIHRYKKSGEYFPSLKVENKTGCVDSVIQKIKIDLLAKSSKPGLPVTDPYILKPASTLPAFDTRRKELAKSISIKQDSVRVLLSDNGIIDGDSVTLIYDGKIILTHHLLKGQPLRLMLPVNKDQPTHELIMYAENLGSIPPNTALMIVYDGTKRYEVYIRSSENTNAVVEFKRSN